METNRNDLIKGVDIRKNPKLLCGMPMVGLCKCWADRKTLELILAKVNLNFEDVENDLDKKDNLYCIYIGGTKRMYNRIVNDHVEGKLKSTLRTSVNGILGFGNNKQLLNDFVDKLYFECISEEKYKQEKKRLLGFSGKFYVLNINESKHKLTTKIKPILNKYRN